jgi:hypothetical protein
MTTPQTAKKTPTRKPATRKPVLAAVEDTPPQPVEQSDPVAAPITLTAGQSVEVLAQLLDLATGWKCSIGDLALGQQAIAILRPIALAADRPNRATRRGKR